MKVGDIPMTTPFLKVPYTEYVIDEANQKEVLDERKYEIEQKIISWKFYLMIFTYGIQVLKHQWKRLV